MSQSRQLAAIMFTDIVGYTALMGQDSVKALELVRINKEIQKPLVKKHRGKWLKEMGDGAMAQFSSAMDAVNCAIDIQKIARGELDAKLRIGIHLGDVTIEENDVHGDGVNVASRLESIADPGGVYISESIERSIQGQSNVQTKFIGEVMLKNVVYGVRTYALQGVGLPIPKEKPEKQLNSQLVSNQPQIRKRLITIIVSIVLIGLAGYFVGQRFLFNASEEPVSDKSIAVLPLRNLNQKDENLDYFSDGVTQEIIDELAKIRTFALTAFTTSIHYKNSKKASIDIARELNVTYLISGSSRVFGDSIRLSIELFNPFSNERIWSRTFNEAMNNAPSIQLSIANQVAKSLNVKLSATEEKSLEMVNTVDGEAFRLFLKAKAEVIKLNDEGFNNSKMFLESALDLDPKYAQAHTLLAWSHFLLKASWISGNNVSTIKTESLALPHLEKAIELDPRSSDAYLVRGNMNLFYRGLLKDAIRDVNYALELNSWPRIPTDYCICTVVTTYVAAGKYEKAKELAKIAREVDPGNVFIFFDQAAIHMVYGEMKEAQTVLTEAVRISDIPLFNFFLGWSYYHDSHYELAIRFFKKAYNVDKNPIPFSTAYLSNAHFKLGNLNESEAYRLELEQRIQNGQNHMNLTRAMISAARNEVNETLSWLEIAQQKRDFGVAYFINVDPIFKSLYKEPRFVEIRREMQYYD